MPSRSALSPAGPAAVTSEHLTSFVRHGGIEQGAGAVVVYDRYMTTKDPLLLEEIARYNEDDVAATMALRDWIVERRPRDMAWREAQLKLVETTLDTDELVERLKKFEEHSPECLLGDLLNYWRRERQANTEPKFAEAASDFATLYGDPDFIANLSFQATRRGHRRAGRCRSRTVVYLVRQLGTGERGLHRDVRRLVHRRRREREYGWPTARSISKDAN